MTQLLDTCCLAARRGGQTILAMTGTRMVRTKSQRDLVTDADLASQRTIFACIRESFPEHGLLGEESDGIENSAAAADTTDRRFLWAIDPLDGTTNFVHGIPYWCVSVAVLRDGQPVAGAIYDPVRDECFSAESGAGGTVNGIPLQTSGQQQLSQALVACSFSAEVTRDSIEVHRFLDLLPHARALRRMGSTALNMAYVAAGRLDGFFTLQTNVWDMAAGGLLIQEAGGAVSAIGKDAWHPLDDISVLATATGELRRAMIRQWNGEG